MILSNFVLVQLLPTTARMLTLVELPTEAIQKRSLWTKNLCYGFQTISILLEQHHFFAQVLLPIPNTSVGKYKDKKVGIVGLGGLGHMGVKFAKAFGAQVLVFTRSEHKREAALDLGADEVIISTNVEDMQKHTGSFDFILDTIAAEHDINSYIAMLKIDGEITMVGAPEKPLPVSSFALLFGRKKLSGSLIGGIKETQEMLDFCGENNITSDVEIISIQEINEAYERVLNSDVKYRFSIDMSSLTA